MHEGTFWSPTLADSRACYICISVLHTDKIISKHSIAAIYTTPFSSPYGGYTYHCVHCMVAVYTTLFTVWRLYIPLCSLHGGCIYHSVHRMVAIYTTVFTAWRPYIPLCSLHDGYIYHCIPCMTAIYHCVHRMAAIYHCVEFGFNWFENLILHGWVK